MAIFEDRREAGRKLAAALSRYGGDENVVVIGLPRGGVIVADEAARRLGVRLEIFITRKIGVPGDPELAAGAVTETGEVFIDHAKVDAYHIHPWYLTNEINEKKKEIARYKELFRGGKDGRDLKGCIAILLDDGVATGTSVMTSLRAIRKQGVLKLILAVPVAPLDMIDALKAACDELIVLAKPHPLYSVSAAYERFDQVSDKEVVNCIQSADSIPVEG